ncbi:MAG TPA: hypothetical protein VFJ43_03990, partial [Bacteroidia bacterium]|nr:hypothetical protein [Bacteroidia bacterium]
PASLTSNKFVAYEVSLLSNTVQLSNSTEKGTFNRTTLGSFALAFPVKSWWSGSFGLVPYSSVGYNVSNADNVPGVGPVTYKYEGSGGVNQVFLSNGIRPFAGAPRHYLLSQKYETLKTNGDTSAMKKHLRAKTNLSNISIGVQTSYLFGALTNIRRDVFPDSLYTFNTKITKRTLFRDVYFNYGIQYSFQLRKSLNPVYVDLADSNVTSKKLFHNQFTYHRNGKDVTAPLFVHTPGIRVSFGLAFSLPTQITTSNDWLAQTYKQVGTIEQFRDTILSENAVRSHVIIPAMYGFGFALKKDYKWMFQADYMTQMWSQASSENVNYGLKNSQRITAGFQLQPKAIGRGNYMTAIQYRLGARWYQTSLELHNVRLTETSVNFGMSLPCPYRTKLGEPVSRATVNFEYGFRGTTDQNLIREDFFRVTIGFTINDRWFSHYKYD